ncbi:hypothetical protein GmHk_01G001960 [Glycine max]|nr:hypothetical protein GmHk_01G001960 [Glycine max]
MRYFNKLIYKRILVNLLMIDLGRHMKNLRLEYLKLGLMLHQVLTLLKNKDLGLSVGLQLQDQSVRDASTVLETLLTLTNVEMTTSCSIHNDLSIEMRVFHSIILQFLPPEARKIIHQQPHQQHQDQQQQQHNDQPDDQQQADEQ